MSIRLEWLSQCMQHSDTYAAWIHQQFDYEYAHQPLSEWQREFAEGQSNGDWSCLVALDGERLVGGAALARDDLAQRPDLGPWLACVFVDPAARGQGLAEQLIEGICREATQRGLPRLYLHTQTKQAYYAKRGWQVMERFRAWDNDQWLMVRDL
ncbi:MULTISPECIES: GNAT family N-acetyltransferase [Pseudomonas]|uniref:Acetyltransferase (GNAT) family protein n=1 Tax=Pseudomonas baetica TaxID=674054 RepID=A0ABX4PWF8_9PSED|nr:MULTISPECIES: GNAT family N-acetyltransferase [Pseudomonas]PKA68543.1 acetyltransferase (GNAT) family protein [Pseudomonas baetica]PTC17608.1 N-acetyltransferase [Pseudomonas baetica]